MNNIVWKKITYWDYISTDDQYRMEIKYNELIWRAYYQSKEIGSFDTLRQTKRFCSKFNRKQQGLLKNQADIKIARMYLDQLESGEISLVQGRALEERLTKIT